MQMRLMKMQRKKSISLRNFRCPQGCRLRRVVMQRQSVTCERLQSSGTGHILLTVIIAGLFFCGGTAPVLNLPCYMQARGWRHARGKTVPRYPLSRKLGGPQSLCGRGCQRKILCRCRKQTPALQQV